MSPKELQYISDALGHQKHLHTRCTTLASQLQDADLKTLVETMAGKHKQAYDKLYQLLK